MMYNIFILICMLLLVQVSLGYFNRQFYDVFVVHLSYNKIKLITVHVMFNKCGGFVNKFNTVSHLTLIKFHSIQLFGNYKM